MPAALLRQVGGWRDVGYEDWDLLVRLMAAGGQYALIPAPVLYHRVRAGSLYFQYAKTHEKRVQAIRDTNNIFFRGFHADRDPE